MKRVGRHLLHCYFVNIVLSPEPEKQRIFIFDGLAHPHKHFYYFGRFSFLN